MNLQKSYTVLKFGNTTFPSLGTFKTRLKVNGKQYLEMVNEAVSGYLSLLIGLEIMRNQGHVLDYGADFLYDKSNKWRLTITYAKEHLFVGTNMHEVMFTKLELKRLHLHFYHPGPSCGKPFNLLTIVKPNETDEIVKRTIDEISKACSNCSDFHTSRPDSQPHSRPTS